MFSKLLLSLTALVSFISISAFAEGWDYSQNPAHWDSNLVYNIQKLPLMKTVSPQKMPWTSGYWPDYKAGVASHWASKQSLDFEYTPPSFERLQKMILSERNKLSPAEKWDILHSNYNYPTVASERGRTRADQVKWAGLCHGWALAATQFEEPQSYHVTNNDGIELDFYSLDIKALLSLAIAPQANQDSVLLGTRCNRSGKQMTNLVTPSCMGVNAGTFHVVLANTIGLKDQAFVTNISRDQEVWNHPIYGYETRILSQMTPSRRASPYAVREVRVETLFYLVNLQDPLHIESVVGTINNPLNMKRYLYWLELDANDNIIGGSWETFYNPGFVWKNRNPIQKFEGSFAELEKYIVRRGTNAVH